jgi:hypothetical protein
MVGLVGECSCVCVFFSSTAGSDLEFHAASEESDCGRPELKAKEEDDEMR